MKTPSDHITVHFPMPHRTRASSAFVWKRAKPSRCMAFMTLIFFSYPPDSLEHRLAARWLIDFGTSARLNFMSTMAAMFGQNWLQSQDHRVLAIKNLDASSCLDIDPSEAGMWMPFMLSMIGQIRVDVLVEMIRSNRELWDMDLHRVRAIPGSERLLADIHSILDGRHDEVSWVLASRDDCQMSLRGMTDRSIRALRPGDALILNPASRSMSLSGLLKKATAIALRCSNDRRLFVAEAVEFREPDNFCVVIHRKS